MHSSINLYFYDYERNQFGFLIAFMCCRCDECGYIVTRPRFLESHKQTHLPDDQKPFACSKCPRRFCWKSALRIHMISHQPASERRQYICHVCGRRWVYYRIICFIPTCSHVHMVLDMTHPAAYQLTKNSLTVVLSHRAQMCVTFAQKPFPRELAFMSIW